MSAYNWNVPPVDPSVSGGLGIVQAVILFHRATRCGLRESKALVEQNLRRAADGGIVPSDLGDLIRAWYRRGEAQAGDA